MLPLLLLVLCGIVHAQTPVNGGVCKSQDYKCAIKLEATAGNTAVFFVASDSGSGTTFTMADSTGDSIAACGTGVVNPTFYGGTMGGNGGAMMAYVVNLATTTSETITATASSQQVDVVGIAEQYSGTLSCDRSASGFGYGSSEGALCRTCTLYKFMPASTANTLTTTYASELLVAAFFNYGILLPTPGTGFTTRQSENALQNFLGVLADKSVGTTGKYAGTANIQNNQQWMGLIVTLH